MSLFKKLFGSLSEEELKRLFLEIESLITFFNEFQNKYFQISSSNISALDNQLLDTSEELEFFFKKIRLNFNTNRIKPTKGQIKDLLKVKKFYEDFKKGQELGKTKFQEKFKTNETEKKPDEFLKKFAAKTSNYTNVTPEDTELFIIWAINLAKQNGTKKVRWQKIINKTGSSYEGQRPYGWGIHTLTDGTIHKGEYKNNRPDGLGIIYFKDGQKIIATFENSIMKARNATLIYENGEKQKGKIIDGKFTADNTQRSYYKGQDFDYNQADKDAVQGGERLIARLNKLKSQNQD